MTQHVDAHYGHVVLVDDSGHFATIFDLGDVCTVDNGPGMYSTDPWTEEQARELGAALIGRAGRKRLARNPRVGGGAP